MLEPLTPIYTAALFAPLHDELIRLLRGLDDADWNRQTVAPAWRVRDVVGHMLDVHLRKLSGGRDGYRFARPASPSFADITAFINGLNAGGVRYSTRLSPRVMTDVLEVAGPWVADFAVSLAPDEPAYISVLWAGEEQSANWMDIGREYTEFWHHQMQIRDAVGAVPLLQRRWLHPLLDLSVRALPRAYASVTAPSGTAIVFEVAGDETYEWTLMRAEAGWKVWRGRHAEPATAITTDADTAWKILYNALPGDRASQRVTIAGNASLAAPLLSARSVMV
jgi:uncharacterized protein (TIGR03083 family)